MGDLRNKFAKLQRDAQHQAWLRKTFPSGPTPSMLYPKCQCGLTVYETSIYQCGRSGYFCIVCMPLTWKADLIKYQLSNGLPFDAAAHGEDGGDQP